MEKGENGEEKKKNCKREGGKLKMEGGKSWKMIRGPFFFFFFFLFLFFVCFSLWKTTKICFGATKMGIFYREKAFPLREKIRKNYFAPSEKFSCYAPGFDTTFLTPDVVYISVVGGAEENTLNRTNVC